jgi:hypothetical protein
MGERFESEQAHGKITQSPNYEIAKLPLGGRLMVGQVPLEHFVQVRILAAQPETQL